MGTPAIQVRSDWPSLCRSHRSSGRHLSDVTQSLAIGLGHFADDPDRAMPTQMMDLGLILEWGFANMLLHEYPDMYYRDWDEERQCWRAGLEVEKDGIVGTLDLWKIGERPMAVEDVKLTRKSSRHDQDGPKWWEAWTRLKGYCWMTGSRIGRLWIAHVFDYSGKFGGDVERVCWERRFDSEEGEAELSGNWAMIVRHEKQMRLEGK